jgi:hypothetical protein
VSEGSASATEALTPERPLVSARRLIAPLALAQFICSFAGSNMNVMINDITLVIAAIVVLSRRLVDPLPADPTRLFDAVGAILSGVGMFFFVFGILQADKNGVLTAVFMTVGAAFLTGFFFPRRGRADRSRRRPAPACQARAAADLIIPFG